MALHPDFPESPHAILDPLVRWFPADEALRDTGKQGKQGKRKQETETGAIRMVGNGRASGG